MREAPAQVQFGGFPRPGPGVKALLVLYTLVGLGTAILVNYVEPVGARFLRETVLVPGAVLTHPWTIVTAGLLTDTEHWGHLIMTLVGIYFLGPDLESRWGMWRFLRFFAIAIVAGYLLSLLLAVATPPDFAVLHRPMYGPDAGLAGLAAAWGVEHAHTQIRLYMILPISGRVFMWVTLGFCVLGVFFPNSVREGVPSPFGGFIAGVLLAGSPSLVRALYLRLKLAFLRRRHGRVNLDLDPRPKPLKRRPGAPPLRVVPGGLEDDLGKRQPPKDKRFLN